MLYTDPDQVVELLRGELPALKERYRVRSLALFGSLVRGEATEASDLGILVEYEQAPSLLEFASWSSTACKRPTHWISRTILLGTECRLPALAGPE